MTNVTIGSLTITEGTEQAHWDYGSEPGQSDRPAVFDDLASAAAAFGGTIKTPAVAPGGFSFSAVEVHASGSLRTAVSVYRKSDRSSFQIEQATFEDAISGQKEEMIIPSSGLRAVSLRSLPAAAWTVELPPPLLRAAPVRLAHLAWEEDGCRFLATSTCLSENDLISVAQSL